MYIYVSPSLPRTSTFWLDGHQHFCFWNQRTLLGFISLSTILHQCFPCCTFYFLKSFFSIFSWLYLEIFVLFHFLGSFSGPPLCLCWLPFAEILDLSFSFLCSPFSILPSKFCALFSVASSLLFPTWPFFHDAFIFFKNLISHLSSAQ